MEDRLAIRGILVGVSFDSAEVELFNVEGGPSLGSLDAAELMVPTEGEPAIVGNWCRRKDVSDCFCIELAVCEVARDAVVELRDNPEFDEFKEEFDVFKVATRCEVDEGRAETCIGGKLTGLAFFGSVEDMVWKHVLEFRQRRKVK